MTERDHSRIGPSSAKRWMNCAGSVQLSEGMPDRTTAQKQADTGTEDHSVLERHLKMGTTPTELDPDSEGVRLFLMHVRSLDLTVWFPEKKLHIPEFLNPPEPMYGTPDVHGYSYADKTLHIIDLKTGRYLVEPEWNEQMLYYAIMAYYALKDKHVEFVTLTVVQPNVMHPKGPIRSWTIPVKELFQFAGKLLNKARDTQDPDAPLVAGDWCMFCPAAAHCPALRDKATAIAQQELPVLMPRLDLVENKPVVVGTVTSISKPPDPKILPTKYLAEIGQQLPILTIWAGAVQEEIERRLLLGESVAGFALADKRVWRRWSETAPDKLLEHFNKHEIYEESLKSPADVEKMVGKKVFKEKFAGLVKRGVPGKKVVRKDSPEALPSADEEFTALPPSAQSAE